VVASWLESPEGFLPILLGAVALLARSDADPWDGGRTRSELRLCGWLAACLGVYLGLVVAPTFPQYLALAVPFLSVLAAAGASMLSSLFASRRERAALFVTLVALYCLPAARFARSRVPCAWPMWEDVARDVNATLLQASEVPRGPLFSTWEHLYFLLRRPPPPGLEFGDGEKLNLPPRLSALVHAVTKAEVEGWLSEGRFASVVTDEKDPRIERLGLSRIYSHRKVIRHGVVLLW
jgi:hypothetical protein